MSKVKEERAKAAARGMQPTDAATHRSAATSPQQLSPIARTPPSSTAAETLSRKNATKPAEIEVGTAASTAATTVTTTDASGVVAVDAQGTPPTAAAASAQTVAKAGSETPARMLAQADKAEADPDDSVSAAERASSP